MNKAKIHILQAGYAKWNKKKNSQKADGTISYIESSTNNIIVDTGLPKDKEIIIKKLKTLNVDLTKINYVICTHGDADHTGNNNLFKNAKLIVGFDIYDNDNASFFENEYIIDKNTKIIRLTGHDNRSIGVEVNEENGKTFIVGDLFEYEFDYKTPQNWISFSKNPLEHLINRAKVYQIADFIIPGHGDKFKVNKKIDIFTIEIKAFKKEMYKNVYGDEDYSL